MRIDIKDKFRSLPLFDSLDAQQQFDNFLIKLYELCAHQEHAQSRNMADAFLWNETTQRECIKILQEKFKKAGTISHTTTYHDLQERIAQKSVTRVRAYGRMLQQYLSEYLNSIAMSEKHRGLVSGADKKNPTAPTKSSNERALENFDTHANACNGCGREGHRWKKCRFVKHPDFNKTRVAWHESENSKAWAERARVFYPLPGP